MAVRLTFPRRLLTERSHSWNLIGVVATAGQTGSSFAPIVRSDGGGFWTCSMTDVELAGKGTTARGRDRQKISTLLWRAVRQACDGGANNIVVPRNDSLFRPWPASASISDYEDIAHADDALFSDGSGYEQPVINIVSGPAALRATAISIRVDVGSDLVGGEAFSIDHETVGWRMYEIASVDYTDSTHATITFNPPLREAISDGTYLEFDRPRCTMRLAAPSSMDLTVAPWTFNRGSVDFVESPTA